MNDNQYGSMKLKILNVVGARPNFMKVAALMDAYKKYHEIEAKIVHTGQHYDQKMSDTFFKELGIPQPDVYLGVGSGNHGEQTGKIMIGFERVLLAERPDLVVVVGDVNSTIACGLVAVKQGVKLAHVEAGLRSYDRGMPEEVNRILTDQISDYLFLSEKEAEKNLHKEGISLENVFFVGNVMIDTLYKHLPHAQKSNILEQLAVKQKQYVLLTLHRPGNVDNIETFTNIISAMEVLEKTMPIIFPVHPRTKMRMENFGLMDQVNGMTNLKLTEPLGYIEFLRLMQDACLVLTDSGGIQEETTALKTPCLTLRENTERPSTVTFGSNQIVGVDRDRIIAEGQKVLAGKSKVSGAPELWDGKAADRVAEILLEQGLKNRRQG